MLKSLIAGIFALIAALGFHHATVATVSATRSPYVDHGAHANRSGSSDHRNTSNHHAIIPGFVKYRHPLKSGPVNNPDSASPHQQQIIFAAGAALSDDPRPTRRTTRELVSRLRDERRLGFGDRGASI